MPRLAVGGVLAGIGVFTVTPSAQADSSYDAFAKATSFDATISNQSIPAGLVIEGIGPAATAHQSSFGAGDANAAFPYVGDTIPGAPGLLGGVLGVPTPAYPLIASSTPGMKPQAVSFPGIDLRADSGPASTVARATAGSEAVGLSASARVDRRDDGSVSAVAESEGRTLSLGGVIHLSGVRSYAEAGADGATGALSKSASASIGRISMPGLAIAIPAATPGTVPLPVPIPGIPNVPPLELPSIPLAFGGQTITAPDIGVINGVFTISLPYAGERQEYAIPSSAVLEAFAAAGVTMTFTAPQDLSDGVVSGSYRFGYALPAPPENSYYTGPTQVTFTTGDSMATVSLQPIAKAVSDDGSFGAVAPGLGVSAPGTVTDGVTALPHLDGIGSGVVPDAAAFPGDGGVLSPDGAERLAHSGPLDGDASQLYLAFVVVAVLAFATATALRLIGVRFLWGS